MGVLKKIALVTAKVLLIGCSAGGSSVSIYKILFCTNTFYELVINFPTMYQMSGSLLKTLCTKRQPEVQSWVEVKPIRSLPHSRVDEIAKEFNAEKWTECLNQCGSEEEAATLFTKMLNSTEWQQVLIEKLQSHSIEVCEIHEYLLFFPTTAAKKLLLAYLASLIG